MTAVRFRPHPRLAMWNVSSAYDEQVIEIIKSLPRLRRVWNPEEKVWVVEDSVAGDLVAQLRLGGCTVFGYKADHFKNNPPEPEEDPFDDPWQWAEGQSSTFGWAPPKADSFEEQVKEAKEAYRRHQEQSRPGRHWGRYEPPTAEEQAAKARAQQQENARREREYQEKLRQARERVKEEQRRRDQQARWDARRDSGMGANWADAMFTAVGKSRHDAVFRALMKVLHPDNPKTGDEVLTRLLIASRDKFK